MPITPITATRPSLGEENWFAERDAFDAEVVVTANAAAAKADAHDTSKADTSHTHSTGDVTSGTFDAARIPDLPASKTTSGTFDAARIPNLDASKLTSGTIDAARLPAIAVTSYLGTAANEAAMLAKTGQEGDWVLRTDLSTTWLITGSDPTLIGSWTQLGYPTAPVTSVAGKTGVVTLVKGDVGLGNVDNLSRAEILEDAALTGNPTAPDADPEVASTAIANMQTVLAGRGALQDAITAGVTGVDKRVYYDAVDGWPSLASQGPAWMLAVMHIIWDSVGHGTGIITPPDMTDGQDWDRDREPA